MTERSVTHNTFVIEREYPHPPARVFAAFQDPRKKAKWFVGPEEWEASDHKLDFRVGGKESVSGGPPGGPTHYYNAIIQDIVPDQRLITSYDMHLDETKISVSLATIELKPTAKGTKLILTEQGAYLDGWDKPQDREEGTRGILDQLGRALDSGLV